MCECLFFLRPSLLAKHFFRGNRRERVAKLNENARGERKFRRRQVTRNSVCNRRYA